MSTLTVDKVEPVGSTLTFGSSGDTMSIPAGATFTNNGTAVGFAAGNAYASQWRLTADFTGDAAPITSNWEAIDAPLGFGSKGAAMTENLGVFTFPDTGIWLITFNVLFNTSASATGYSSIHTTHNDSTYALASDASATGYYNADSTTCSYMMNVSSTTTHKVRFHNVWSGAAASQTTRGSSDSNETFVTFIRLAA